VKLNSARNSQSMFCIIYSFKVVFAVRSFHAKEEGEGEIVSLALHIPSFGDFREFAGTHWKADVCHNWEKLDPSPPLGVCMHNFT